MKHTWTYATFAQYNVVLTYTSPNGFAPGVSAADYTTTWTHDAKGSVTKVTFPKSMVAGALVHTANTYVRNAVGLITSQTLAGGLTQTFEYAPNTYLMTKMTSDPTGLNLQWQYAYGVPPVSWTPGDYKTHAAPASCRNFRSNSIGDRSWMEECRRCGL